MNPEETFLFDEAMRNAEPEPPNELSEVRARPPDPQPPTIKRTVEIIPTAEEVAEFLAHTDAEIQADFLNRIAVLINKWEGYSGMQLITVIPLLTPEALQMVETFQDYAGDKDVRGG